MMKNGRLLAVSEVGSSDSVFPTSLFIHSWVRSPELFVIPGTTSGILVVLCRSRVCKVLVVCSDIRGILGM
jgi:hypothetical protein